MIGRRTTLLSLEVSFSKNRLNIGLSLFNTNRTKFIFSLSLSLREVGRSICRTSICDILIFDIPSEELNRSTVSIRFSSVRKSLLSLCIYTLNLNLTSSNIGNLFGLSILKSNRIVNIAHLFRKQILLSHLLCIVKDGILILNSLSLGLSFETLRIDILTLRLSFLKILRSTKNIEIGRSSTHKGRTKITKRVSSLDHIGTSSIRSNRRSTDTRIYKRIHTCSTHCTNLSGWRIVAFPIPIGHFLLIFLFLRILMRNDFLLTRTGRKVRNSFYRHTSTSNNTSNSSRTKAARIRR